MSYTILSDAVEFTCHGCRKTARTKKVSELPKGWCLTGILVSQHHEEFADPEAREQQNKDLIEANNSLCGHFCSRRCTKEAYSKPRVVEFMERIGVTVVAYEKSYVIWAPSAEEKEEPEDDNELPGERGRRPKSPPPFELGSGGPAI